MNEKTTNIILIAFVAAAVLAGAFFYPSLPDRLVSHWNAAGEADGTMSKFWGVFLLPMVMAGIFVLYLMIPRLDPLRKNIESFRKSYDLFWVFMLAFMFFVFLLMMAWNLGYRFNFTYAMIPAIAALLYAVGYIIERSRRNWFMGIRTPWTLSSDIVWEKTHRFGGRLFKIAAVISLAGLFLHGPFAVAALVLPIAAAAAASVVYSYIEYRKLSH